MPNCTKVVLDARQPARSQYTRDPQGKSQPQLTNTETWTVVYDGYAEATDVFSATANGTTLPQAGFVYNGLFCTRVNPQRDSGSPFVWRVTIDYVNIQQEQNQGTNTNITLSQSSVAREETSTVDGLGLPYFNTAGELLPQLPNATLYDKLITISWHTTVAPSWASTIFEGTVNSDALSFTICGLTYSYQPFQAKCAQQSINCTRTTIGEDSEGDPIYQLSYDCQLGFQIRSFKPFGGKEYGWVWCAPNEGYKGWDASGNFGLFTDNGVMSPAKPRAGTPRTDPTRLDINGQDMQLTGADPTGRGVIILPYDAVAYGPGSQYSNYAGAGRFVPYKSQAFSSLFNGLQD